MRFFLPFGLLSILACAGLPTGSPGDAKAPPPPPTQTEPAAPAAPPVAGSPAPASTSGPELADRYLVILGSKRDPAEVIPGLAILASHPEVQAKAQTLLSSRYKNLMPCYTVTFAGAFAELKPARALVKALADLGVESYVKNSGSFVGKSVAIDNFCARGPEEGSLKFGLASAGSTWLPVELPESTVAGLAGAAPAPKMISGDRGTWEQPLSIRNAGLLSIDGSLPMVDLSTGRGFSCTIQAFSFLTTGTPHFGVQDMAGEITAPTCGSPELMSKLDCPASSGPLLQIEESRVEVFPLTDGPTTPWAEAALKANSDWEPLEAGWTRDIKLHVAGKYRVIEAKVGDGNGVCGGTEFTLIGVYTAEGQPVAPLRKYDFTELEGLVDLERDGKPELLLGVFPSTLQLVDLTGEVLASQALAYCDCPC